MAGIRDIHQQDAFPAHDGLHRFHHFGSAAPPCELLAKTGKAVPHFLRRKGAPSGQKIRYFPCHLLHGFTEEIRVRRYLRMGADVQNKHRTIHILHLRQGEIKSFPLRWKEACIGKFHNAAHCCIIQESRTVVHVLQFLGYCHFFWRGKDNNFHLFLMIPEVPCQFKTGRRILVISCLPSSRLEQNTISFALKLTKLFQSSTLFYSQVCLSPKMEIQMIRTMKNTACRNDAIRIRDALRFLNEFADSNDATGKTKILPA